MKGSPLFVPIKSRIHTVSLTVTSFVCHILFYHLELLRFRCSISAQQELWNKAPGGERKVDFSAPTPD